MAVYDGEGAQLSNVYDGLGNALQYAYDGLGNIIFRAEPTWFDEITVNKYRESTTNTAYYVVRIPQTRTNGSKQYPFVYVPNGANGATMSTYDMVQRDGFYMGINAGYFDYSQNQTYRPYGITIENGVLIREDDSYYNNLYTLTISPLGELGYENPMSDGITGQDVLDDGVVSAVLGYVPLVVNGIASPVGQSLIDSTYAGQRQIFGQYPNGDYCVVTIEGRNFDSSSGLTYVQAQAICLDLGLEYAHAMDGGGSTETVIGDEQLNVIYQGTTGRLVPTYIVFNGTDTFGVPNA